MKAELSGINIIMLGSFNPKIFQPAWFAANELIRKVRTWGLYLRDTDSPEYII